MKNIFVSLSATSSTSPFDKGDRVVAKFDSNEWYVGKVSANRAGRVYIEFDDGESESYPFGTKSVLKINPKQKKNEDELTDAQAAKLASEFKGEPGTPKNKSNAVKIKLKSKTEKPVATAAKEQVNIGKFFSDNLSSATHFSESDYANNPLLGMKINTGRVGASGTGFVIGVSQRGRTPELIVYTAKSGTKVNSVSRPIAGYGEEAFNESLEFAKKKSSGRVSYKEFLTARSDIIQYKAEIERDKEARATKSVLSDPNFKLYDAVGKNALIQFSNGKYLQRILDVDYQKQAIAIKGGGSKRRWISLRNVLQVS